jgi:hypothetical protein
MSGGGDDGASSANKSTSSHSGRGGRIQPLFDESRVGRLKHDQEGHKAPSVTPPSTPKRLGIIKTPENGRRPSSSSASIRSSSLSLNNNEKLQIKSMLRDSDKVIKPSFLDMEKRQRRLHALLCGYMWIVNYVQWIRHDDVG